MQLVLYFLYLPKFDSLRKMNEEEILFDTDRQEFCQGSPNRVSSSPDFDYRTDLCSRGTDKGKVIKAAHNNESERTSFADDQNYCCHCDPCILL